MKIILVNYRYFFSGGPERYMFNIKQILESHGHEVIPFSVKSKRNEPCEYEKYFIEAVDDDVYYTKGKKSLKVIFKSFTRMFYSFEAKKNLKKLIADTNPNIVYVLQMHNKISPSIFYAAREMKVPIVHRISDFNYMCSNAIFYNDKKGICEDCIHGKRLSCITCKCVLDSPLYSGIKVCAKLFHDMIGVTKKVNAFVVPSEFTYEKLHEYGIPYEKLNLVSTFFNLKEKDPQVEYKPFVLYVGRIEKQKGLMTLVKTFEDLPYELKIIGFSEDGYEEKLKKYLGKKESATLYGKNENIEFLGKMNFDEIAPYLKSCLCTTVPSEWYDNFPNSLIESYAFKKAVIATDFGSLQYMVKDGETGFKFKYADIEDFRDKIRWMFEHEEEAKKMGKNGYKLIDTVYSPETHYDRLMKIFNSVLE